MVRGNIQWTATAKAGLAKLPKKVRRGILDKANELLKSHNPAAVHKPLRSPLQGYFRFAYSRYRAIYSVEQGNPPGGDSVLKIKVLFVAVGIRKEGDKKDIYKIAQKLFDLGVLDRVDDPASANE